MRRVLAICFLWAMAISFSVLGSESSEVDQYARLPHNDLTALADKGDPVAQFVLGLKLYHGRGIPENKAGATSWFRKAAEQGYADAQYNLGCMAALDDGIPENMAEARSWFRKAAEQGHAGAQNNLGLMLYLDVGLGQNEAEGMFWLRKAAAQGHPLAQLILGIILKISLGMMHSMVLPGLFKNISAAFEKSSPSRVLQS